MRGGSIAAMEHFDGVRRDAYPHRLAQQSMRHGVVMVFDFDVIIEGDLAFLPFRVDVRLDGQWLEGWAFDLIEQRTPTRSQVPCHPVIELRGQLADGRV